MSMGDRIREARQAAGLTQQQVADKIGVSKGAVSLWESGDTKTLKGPNLYAFADATRYNAGWLMSGRGPKQRSSNIEPGPSISRLVPLISWVRAGHWTDAVDPYAVGDAQEWLSCPVPSGSRTFVLRVRGISMEPRFHDGDLIFVDPDRAAQHRDFVVVRINDSSETTFKQLVLEADRRYLKALNPAWPEPIIEINSSATITGVVIFRGEKL